MRTPANQSLINTSFVILTASLPFMTIGMLNGPIILVISLIFGGVGLAGLIAGMLLQVPSALSKLGKIQLRDYFFPYVLALSSATLETHGIDASSGYWLALAIALAVLITSFLPDKRSSH